ncbi:MAG: phosphoesterase [Alphaproteobacteria bacterium]|nr:phosphoesterase [Alphaproteobacteria bacterium]
MLANSFIPSIAVAAEAASNDGNTATPIKHIIVIIGENRTFDHVFATYVPEKKGETVLNLLSQNIIKADGSPGVKYASALQLKALDQSLYQLSPPKVGAYATLPAPLAGGGYTNGQPPFSTTGEAETYENGLPPGYYKYLTTGAVPAALLGKPDTRISYAGHDVNSLPAGPYQLTPGLAYDDFAESPVHRFYQMWQQLDCSGSRGCGNDLFPWVEATVGAGSNGSPPPTDFTYKEGATSMGFYNVQQGDAPYFKELADKYTMSDNYHQAVNGGTGANHIMMGTGDAIWFSDGRGTPAKPPHNQLVAGGSKNAGVVDEIENPNPLPGTNNWYTEDGYGGGSYGSASSGGGSYTECADATAPGVQPIVDYLKAKKVKPNCQPGHYYLLNNYNPGYYGDGTSAYADIKNPLNTVFTVPPSNVPNIGDALLKKNISFAYFGDQFNAYLANPYNNYVTPDNQYCNICNFFQYSTSIMTNDKVRKAALQDTSDLYNDLMTGNLPAVSFVKPSGYLDGHPASSKLDLLEGFVKKVVDLTKENKDLWGNTAIFVTMDEGGGYYDSGYVQPLDYFGDGTRIPMIAVSKYSKGGHISHVYSDHVSILKFIEANWGVAPITNRSRDNLPNPVNGADPYEPTNGPAIGDLMDLFDFR